MASLFLSDNLVELYVDPTYLFPIIGVLLSGLTVYVFGFNKTTKNPPTLQLFANGKEKRSQLAGKKDKKKDKDVGSGKPSKVQANGVVTGGDTKASLIKKAKSNQVESPKKVKAAVPAAKPANGIKGKSAPTKKDKKSNEANSKKKVEDAENIDVDIEKAAAIQDAADGEWVEAISRKKSRKMKEEAAKVETKKNESSTGVKPQASPSPSKPKKKDKENIDSNIVQEKVQEKIMTPEETNKPEKAQNKEKSTEKSEKTATAPKEAKVVKPSKAAKAAPVETNSDDLIAEDPEQYAFEKEGRVTKKLSKDLAAKNRRKGDSGTNKAKGNTASEVIDEETKPVEKADKITATILANYENGNVVAEKKKKPQQQQNTSNNKSNQGKKKPNQADKLAEMKKEVEAVPVTQTKAVSDSVPKTDIKEIPVLDGVHDGEVAPQDDDGGEFKLATSKKRRARREQ